MEILEEAPNDPVMLTNLGSTFLAQGEHEEAKQLFAQIPAKVRNKLLSTDFSLAEARCPQHLPIGRLVAEAANKLA